MATGTKPTVTVSLNDVTQAAEKLIGVIRETITEINFAASEAFGAEIYFKREDLQVVRSYKIRGAYNKIISLPANKLTNGIVCASAGNHAQGVALACKKLGIKGTIFMPAPTPKQKLDQVKFFGKADVEIVLYGDTFDDAYKHAITYCKEQNATFIHPFDDELIIAGQGTVALEILNQVDEKIDYLFLPVGGGGLAAGVSTVFRILSPDTKIIGVEPEGAPSMKKAFEAGEVVCLENINRFTDGASVKQVGEKTFEICKKNLDDIITVPEGKICETMLQLYSRDAMVVEPAGALSVAALDNYKHEIKGKTVVCIVSGGNNDISRTEEIREKALMYQGLKHYFMVTFPQRAGALKEFVSEVLGPDDDIVHFEYVKKFNREKGPALVGIELKSKDDLQPLVQRMKERDFLGDYLNSKPSLLEFIT